MFSLGTKLNSSRNETIPFINDLRYIEAILVPYVSNLLNSARKTNNLNPLNDTTPE